MGSIKDKSINDVAANAERVASEATDAVVDTASDVAEKVSEHVTGLSTNTKLVIVGAASVVVSTVVSRFISKWREVRVTNNFVTEVVDVETEVEGGATGL